jgi:glycosyltransferase involved in cell wall biosynthesis
MIQQKKYKIVYCTPALYSAGGIERVITAKANYFAEHFGYEVTIIVTDGNGGHSFFHLSEKVKVVNLGLAFEELWNKPLYKKFFLYCKKQRKYKKLLKSELLRIRPDFTISTLRREINFINGIHDGSRKIGELHQSRSYYRRVIDSNSYFIKWFFSFLWKKDIVGQVRKLDKFVVLTDSAVHDWPELDNVRMIPDPLTIDVSSHVSSDRHRVIAVGRYSDEKGHDLLLRVWSLVEKACPDWQLDVYGPGDRTSYLKMMDDLSIDKSRCHLNDNITDVEDEYYKSSIFVHPSRSEGFGLVIVEAMACGLPVVSFDCENGPRSIITDEVDGYLIPTFDIRFFANRIIKLAKDKDLRKRMGDNGRLKSHQYGMEQIGQQWKSLFDELIQTHEV